MIGDTYYSLTISASGTTQSHYCSIQPDPSITFLQGGFSFAVTEAKPTSVTIYPQVAQLQIPPSSIVAGGVTVATKLTTIAGGLIVSPAAEVPFTLTLYGIGGEEIGSKTLEPGATQMYFGWDVSPANGGSLDDALNVIKAAVGK
ncbi:MAG TPA: hypothetical protein VF608_14945 [Thermoanaerobaculia bacterium]